MKNRSDAARPHGDLRQKISRTPLAWNDLLQNGAKIKRQQKMVETLVNLD
jgi:hypothetical protein